MVEFMKESSRMTGGKAMVNSYGQTKGSMKACGRMANRMAKEDI
jgi:hypothetical protein